jgi:hypothetical protein
VVNGGREWIEDGWLAFLNEFLLLATGVLFYEVGSVRLVGTVWRSWIEELELGVLALGSNRSQLPIHSRMIDMIDIAARWKRCCIRFGSEGLAVGRGSLWTDDMTWLGFLFGVSDFSVFWWTWNDSSLFFFCAIDLEVIFFLVPYPRSK